MNTAPIRQPAISHATRAVGFWSGVLATLFSVLDSVGQLAEWGGWLGSATLFAALAIPGGGTRRIARWFLFANGLLLPFLALQMYVHGLIWFASFWAVTFPGATFALALLFRRMPVTALSSSQS